MRERGVQSRRARSGQVEPARRPAAAGSSNAWQALAIVALIAATAGWTTVAVLALRDPSPAAVATPTESLDPNATEEPTLPPVADTHDAPELEALLPMTLDDTPLQSQSWKGSGILTDDPFGTSLTTFLTDAGKTAADLQIAQAADPAQGLDCLLTVYRVDGVDGTATRDALLAAWMGDDPDLTVSEGTVEGKAVTKYGFGESDPTSFLYVRDEFVFDIQTSDAALATAAFTAIEELGAVASPGASSSPAASTVPAPAASASPAP